MKYSRNQIQHIIGLVLTLAGVSVWALLLHYSSSRPLRSEIGIQDHNQATQASIASPTSNANPLVSNLTQADPALRARVREAYGELPLSFEANQGQTDPQVRFFSRGRGYTLFLTPTEAVLALQSGQQEVASGQWSVVSGQLAVGGETNLGISDSLRRAPSLDCRLSTVNRQLSTVNCPLATEHWPLNTAVVRMKLLGANPSPQIKGLGALGGKSNYFFGKDPKQWRVGVRHYARVRYQAVYPGVDLIYYGNQRQLEFDFEVSPGADPRQIQMVFDGIEKMEIGPQGDLVLRTPGGQLQQRKPRVYQRVDGVTKVIQGHYSITFKNRARFEIADYDVRRPLVIDPALNYASYLGGVNWDHGFAIAADSLGNSYVAGFTFSSDFPTTATGFKRTLGGADDVFVSKLNAAGTSLIYSTYLGGNNSDAAFGIAVDDSGNAYVTGRTLSSNFPTTAGAYRTSSSGGEDAFVSKLDSTGTALVYSTYLGGNNDDSAKRIAVDATGAAYVTGLTKSTNFPTTSGATQTTFGGEEDAFVSKLDATGTSLIYSTYLGGTKSDIGSGIALDASGNAYVAGGTESSNFPTTAGAYQTIHSRKTDAFVTKLNSTGTSLIYSTYLGGVGNDAGLGIAVDASRNAYVAGGTESPNFPITTGAYQTAHGGGADVFITKLNPEGNGLIYSTFLGGSGHEIAHSVAIDSDGFAFVIGQTGSINLPTVNALQSAFGSIYGIFKSTNSASDWRLSNTGLGSFDFNALIIDPLTASTLYACTNGGIFKSTDSGANWSRISSGLTFSPHAHALLVHPTTPTTLFAGGDFGVFQSADGGLNWIESNRGLTGREVRALVMDPTNSSILYAGTSIGVLKSTDSADTWGASNSGLTSTSINTLAIDLRTPATLYAGTSAGSIFKTTNSGTNWSSMSVGLGSGAVNSVVIDPNSSTTLYAGTDFGVYKSANGGTSWSASSNGLALNSVFALAIDPANSANIYAGTDDGVFKSTNSGSTWSKAGTGITSSIRILSLAIPRSDPATIYAGIESLPDALIAILEPAGDFLHLSTFLGGPTRDKGLGIAVDPFGGIHTTGVTQWDALPTTTGAYQVSSGGGFDAFVLKLGGSPSLLLTLSQANYTNGETVTAANARFKNPYAEATAIKLELSLATPGGERITILELGSNGSFIIPANFNQNLGPIPMFQVRADLPRGKYELCSRMESALTGKPLFEDRKAFVIR